MLRYTDYDIVFREIPDETTLAVNLAGCPNRCPWCVVPRKEGGIRPHADIEEFLAGRRRAVLLLSLIHI